MKAEKLTNIKRELRELSREELQELCLKLARFKLENKELLTYLLFESSYEPGYVETIKKEIDLQFEDINDRRFYQKKKGVRKILRLVKKYTRYSKNKDTEITLLIYFCQKLAEIHPSIKRTILQKMYDREITSIQKKIDKLHEDLQLDYRNMLEDLERF